MCTWEGAPAWEHARRWRVGNPAGSAGGRLRLRGCAILYQLVYQPVCAPGPDFIQYTVLAFCEFSFGPDIKPSWLFAAKTLTDLFACCEFSFGPDIAVVHNFFGWPGFGFYLHRHLGWPGVGVYLRKRSVF